MGRSRARSVCGHHRRMTEDRRNTHLVWRTDTWYLCGPNCETAPEHRHCRCGLPYRKKAGRWPRWCDACLVEEVDGAGARGRQVTSLGSVEFLERFFDGIWMIEAQRKVRPA
jgi:hypothetical protein